MARSRRDPSSYEIGYAKPPETSRFQPGQSGNPRGRPKGSRSIGAILQEIMQQTIVVSEKGRPRKIAVLKAMLSRLANDALRGNPQAMKLLLYLLDRYPGSGETTIDPRAMQAEEVAILQHYLSLAQSGSEASPDRPGDSEPTEDGAAHGPLTRPSQPGDPS